MLEMLLAGATKNGAHCASLPHGRKGLACTGKGEHNYGTALTLRIPRQDIPFVLNHGQPRCREGGLVGWWSDEEGVFTLEIRLEHIW